MTFHIYVTPKQPLTRYKVMFEHGNRVFKTLPYALYYCRCCHTRRRAKNLVVQVYYDDLLISCKDGKGCKA